jgi:protein-L-isoaspartate(D-aspartate) O-methyltransferase
MDRQQKLAIVRRAYARRLMASEGITNPGIEAAERYLGPGPWPILHSVGYIPTPDADPVHLYSDVLIGIIPERGLNNGMPSYHVSLLASADIRAGDHVVHIGAGVGYYTAIMACLVGPSGRITGTEFDAGFSAVGLYPCDGGRDDASEAALDAAFQKGGWRAVTRLYRTGDLPDERCWLRGAQWALAYD